VLRGTKDLGQASVETIGASAGSVVKTAAQVGGDVAVAAKGAVEGAIIGAREIGVDAAEAASAAATGALAAAGDISTAATEQVRRAVTGVISGVKVVVKEPFK
jgi:hypothetical protein